MISGILIAAIVIGGALLLAAGVIALIVVVRKAGKAHLPTTRADARDAAAARGWAYAERDDAWVPVFDRQHDLRGWAEPFRHPPRATAATDVFTGVHRGHPFVVAAFDTVHARQRQRNRAIWVAAPVRHPRLSARRIIGPQNALNRGIGRGGVQTGDAEFDRSFEVYCADETFARNVLGPGLRMMLLRDPRPFRGFQLLGEYLDVLDPVEDRRDTEQLARALDLRCDILERIPSWTSAGM